MPETVSHALLLELVAAGSVRSAVAIADGDCWFLMVRYGRIEKTLRSKSGKIRSWRKLDSLAKYIIVELGLSRFEVDGANYDPSLKTLRRPDSAEVLKRVHAQRPKRVDIPR